MQTPLTVPFAFLIERNSIEFLVDEVGPEEWERKRLQLTTLAMFTYQNDPMAGGDYYVVFPDPNHRTVDFIVNAAMLREMYNTKFYNEEILLITPKQ